MDWRACVAEATRLRDELNDLCTRTEPCKDSLSLKIWEASRLIPRIEPVKWALGLSESMLAQLQLGELAKAEIRLVSAMRLATRTLHAETPAQSPGLSG